MRVLIVPDKFKGTLDACRVAAALARGWTSVRTHDTVELLPMTDGGDGFGEILGNLLHATRRETPTVNAAHRPHTASWWFAADRHTAVVETAQSNGLALLPPRRFHPFELDTTGVAELVRAAHAAGARSAYLGVGGSATNDGGFGLARGLGWRFFDAEGGELLVWTDLARLDRIQPPARPLTGTRWIVATDVANPLLGPEGATRVYGPQKGLQPGDLPAAEACLARLADRVRETTGFDSTLPGCGAAGGLGFGLQAFLGAERQLGFDVFSSLARLPERVEAADLVVTGEGSADASSLMGKGVGELLRLAASRHRRVILAAGRLACPVSAFPGVERAADLLGIVGETSAMQQPEASLEELGRRLAQGIGSSV